MSDESRPFEKCGRYTDEIKIRFDKDEYLYVSKTFLCHISVVFINMFKETFKEGKTSTLVISDTSKDNFLEFLLCCNPGTMKELTYENVCDVITIAHKYDVMALVQRCKNVMDKTLKKYSKRSYELSKLPIETNKFRMCLRILQIANLMEYADTIASAMNLICKFSSLVYIDPSEPHEPYGKIYIQFSPEALIHDRQFCAEAFNGLPLDIRYRILYERLKSTDKW